MANGEWGMADGRRRVAIGPSAICHRPFAIRCWPQMPAPPRSGGSWPLGSAGGEHAFGLGVSVGQGGLDDEPCGQRLHRRPEAQQQPALFGQPARLRVEHVPGHRPGGQDEHEDRRDHEEPRRLSGPDEEEGDHEEAQPGEDLVGRAEHRPEDHPAGTGREPLAASGEDGQPQAGRAGQARRDVLVP